MDPADQPGDEAAQREGHELVAIGRHAEYLGHVLVVADGEEPHTPPRAEDRQRGGHGEQRDHERQMIERGRRSAEQLRDRDRRQEDAGAAVDPRVEGDRGQHERHGEREEPEELSADSADAEDDRGDRGTEERRHQSGRRQRPEEWHVERRRERGRGVDAGAEEGGVAEAEVAGVAAEDVPAGRQGDPEEHQIEEGLVEGR